MLLGRLCQKRKFRSGILRKVLQTFYKRMEGQYSGNVMDAARRVIKRADLQTSNPRGSIGDGSCSASKIVETLHALSSSIGGKPLDAEPTPAQCSAFVTACETMCPSQLRRILGARTKTYHGAVHEKYIETITALPNDIHDIATMWCNDNKKYTDGVHPIRRGQYSKHDIIEFVILTFELRQSAPPSTPFPQLAAHLDSEGALEFCLKGAFPSLWTARLRFLDLTGVADPPVTWARLQACSNDWKLLADTRRTHRSDYPILEFRHMHLARQWFGADIGKACAGLSEQAIDAVIDNKTEHIPTRRSTKVLVRLLLARPHSDSTEAPRSVKTHLDRFSSHSEWHERVALHALEHTRRRARANETKAHQRNKSDLGLCLRFLQSYAVGLLPAAPHALAAKKFLETCTADDLFEFTLAFARSRPVRNDLVVSASTTVHHASNSVNLFLRFLRSIHGLLPNVHADDIPNQHRILARLENKRQAASITDRRVYTERELQNILTEAQKSGHRTHLFARMLVECAPRLQALSSMQFRHFIDEQGCARKGAVIIDKGGKQRQLAYSKDIQQAALELWKETVNPHLTNYTFNTQNPTDPLSSTAASRLVKSLGTNAGVGVKRFLAHQFRHTLVGRIMDAGNTIDVASRFLGHASTSVTMQHYWLAEAVELEELLKPIETDNHSIPDDASARPDCTDLEIKVYKRKQEAATEILTTILHAIDQEDDGGKRIKARVTKALPNISQIVAFATRTVEDELAAT